MSWLARKTPTAPAGFNKDQVFAGIHWHQKWQLFQGVFTPPSRQGTIIWPGNIGGMNWSGVSVDEARGILIAPTNRLATVVRVDTETIGADAPVTA